VDSGHININDRNASLKSKEAILSLSTHIAKHIRKSAMGLQCAMISECKQVNYLFLLLVGRYFAFADAIAFNDYSWIISSLVLFLPWIAGRGFSIYFGQIVSLLVDIRCCLSPYHSLLVQMNLVGNLSGRKGGCLPLDQIMEYVVRLTKKLLQRSLSPSTIKRTAVVSKLLVFTWKFEGFFEFEHYNRHVVGSITDTVHKWSRFELHRGCDTIEAILKSAKERKQKKVKKSDPTQKKSGFKTLSFSRYIRFWEDAADSYATIQDQLNLPIRKHHNFSKN